MKIYISTNAYSPNNLENVFSLLEKIDDKNIGIELFPEWHDKEFEEILEKNKDRFRAYNLSLHGPYYYTEHSSPMDTEEYEKTKEYFIKTLQLSKDLNSKYIVFHHNNCIVEEEKREEMLRNSTENLMELNELAKEYGACILVENAGVLSRNNVLFNEEEFIEMAKGIENKILIDIGHAFANNWNLENLVSELKDKIVSYHLHNNDGIADSHNRILDGKLSIEEFFSIYKKYTPTADLVIEYSKISASEDGLIDDINTIKELVR